MSALLTPPERQARQARRSSSRTPVGRPASDQTTATHQLAAANETNDLLRSLLSRENLALAQLTITNNSRRIRRMRDWPIPGASRYIVPSQGFGGIVQLASGTPTLLLAHNESRLGGQIVVSGSAAVLLQLCGIELAQTTQMAPSIWLQGSGGEWDFMLTRSIWGGSVVATAQGGASSVSVAEV